MLNKIQKKRDESWKQNTVPKNTDKTLYLSGDKAKICSICGGRYARMVSHFKNVHPDCEVFVSRISPRMVANVDTLASTFIKYSDNGHYLRAMCVFCEDKRDFSIYYWMDHIRSHTGEYANICTLCQKCVCFTSHCGMHTQRLEENDILRNNVHAHLCNECNYLQLNEENMRGHLKNQHNCNDHDCRQRYKTFLLLPAIKSLHIQPNPKVAAVGSESNAMAELVAMSAMPAMPNTPASNEQFLQPENSRDHSPANEIQVLENLVIRPANTNSGETFFC